MVFAVRRRVVRSSVAIVSLLLAGCGAVLGIQDIEHETPAAVDGGPEAGPKDAGDDSPAPRHCAANAEIATTEELTGLRDDSGVNGEDAPRLTHDELTIVFRRVAPGGGVLGTFVAHRSTLDAPFESPHQLLVAGGKDGEPAFTAITHDGTRIFFSQVAPDAGTARALRTAVRTEGVLDPRVIPNLGDDTDSVFPFPVDETRELFFARSTELRGPSRVYRLYRATGAGEAFTSANEVTTVETIAPADGFVTSYNEPVLSDDGRHLYFTARGIATVGSALDSSWYVAARLDPTSPTFEKPELLRMFDQSMPAGGIGALSPDDCRLYTYRKPAGGPSHLFVETRKPVDDD